jgi:hypothetical protein
MGILIDIQATPVDIRRKIRDYPRLTIFKVRHSFFHKCLNLKAALWRFDWSVFPIGLFK